MFIVNYINYKYYINDSLSRKSILCFSLLSRTRKWIQIPKELGGILSPTWRVLSPPSRGPYVTGGDS